MVDGGLKVEIHLSRNNVAMNGSMSISMNLTNDSKSDMTVDLNGMSAWITLTDSRHAPISEIPFLDEIVAPENRSPLFIPRGGSELVRVFGATVTKGSWNGFGQGAE
jgi:hypothetical protein